MRFLKTINPSPKIATKINAVPKYYMVKIDNSCAYKYYNG